MIYMDNEFVDNSDNEFVDNSDNENTFCCCCDERKKSENYTIDKKVDKYYRYPKSVGQKTKIYFWKQSMNKK